MDIINLHVHKLGHELEEIRTRSLDNICNKIDMGLMSEEELIENPDFVKNIIKWFTFPQVPKKDIVIKLILRITKIDRGKALIIRHDPKLNILQEATKDDGKDLFEEILLSCREFVESPGREVASSLELSVASRKPKMGTVWILWKWLPEVDLADSDLQLISSLHSSLLSADQFYHSAHFFSYIVLKDFPPQLFLQRPHIINVFLDIIQSRKSESGMAVECLEDLTYALNYQIKSCCNIHVSPLLSYQVKVGSSDLSLSTIGSFRSTEESSLEICKKDSQPRKIERMDLMEYCVAVLEAIVRGERYSDIGLIRAILNLLRVITCDPNIPWHQAPVHRCSNVLAMLHAASHHSQVLEALDKLELNIAISEILSTLVPVDVADIALNKPMLDSLYQCLLDPVLFLVFPKIHSSLSAYINKCKYAPSAIYRILSQVGDSIKSGANFLLSSEKLSLNENIQLFSKAIEGIEYHQNYTIIVQFLQLCVKRFTEMLDSDKETATRAVLLLLSSSDVCIIKTTLSELYQLAKKILGPGDLSKVTSSNIQPLSFILINHKILIEIISYCLHAKNKELAILSEDILILIIKSRSIMNEKNWNLILTELVPTFPYLQVFGGQGSILGKEILHLFDPDTAYKFQMLPLHVFVGNMRFLVSKEAGTRDEAISRLMYLLDMPSKPLNLILPHDPIVPRKNLNDIYEASSMTRIIDLLKESGLDIRVIKSALVQLSIMTEDILLHDLFVQYAGLDVIYSYLSSYDKEFYKEVFGPSVTILKNLVRSNGKIRHEYSLKLDVLKNIVRGLFLYDLDWRLQRDVSQFLVLVVFSSVLQTSADTVSFPVVILDRIRNPFPSTGHGQISIYAFPSRRDELLSDTSRRNLLALQWALGFYGGNVDELLKNYQGGAASQLMFNSSSPLNTLPILSTHPVLLPLPKSSFADLMTCHPFTNIALALEKLATATSHKRAFDSLESLRRYMPFLIVAEQVEVTSLPWEESFTRYLATPPSSTTDQQLLLQVMKFFNLRFCNFRDHISWLSKLFQEPSPVMIYLLKQTACDECTSLKKELCMETLKLLKKCIKGCKNGWESVFSILIDALNERHTLGFYCLGVVQHLVGCIAEICKVGLVSHSSIDALYRLIPAFQPTSPISYMGLSITSLTLLSLNQSLAKRKHQDWSKDWDLKCIVDRLACRDVVVKASTLQLLSGLCHSAASTSQVISSSKDLWSSCLTYLLDHNEVNIVREQAAILCGNILYHLENKMYVAEAESRGLYRVIAIICSKLSTDEVLPASKISMIQSSTRCLASLGSSSAGSEDDSISSDYNDNRLLMTTLGLLEASCRLVINLACISSEVIDPLRTQGLSSALFRYISQWYVDDAVDGLKLRLFCKICKLLSLCPSFVGTFINDTLCSIVWILQSCSLIDQELNENTIDSLKTEAITLLSSLLFTYPDARVHFTNRCLKTIINSLTSQNINLQSAALKCIPSIAPSLNSKGSELMVEKLISLWNKTTLKASTKREVCLALASLLGNSHAATMAALNHGLAESLVLKLRETYVTLNVLPPDIPRQKKCNAVLAGLSVDIALLSNLLAGNEIAKELSSSLGATDSLHKLWNWCLLDFSLVSSLLQALITFSASSPQGSLSLVLTSTVVGVGQRKSPSSSSMLHAVLQLLSMPVYTVDIKKRVLQLASHACQSQECRVVISKSSLLKDFLKFNNEKKNSPALELELAWLEFFCVITSYPEGSNVLQDQEFLNYLTGILNGSRKDLVKLSLNIFRNLSFQSSSRQKLLMSDNVLSLMAARLLDDSLILEEEKLDIILFVWAMCANNQKSKQVMRNFGFLNSIQLQSVLIPEYTMLSTIVNTTLSVLKS